MTLRERFELALVELEDLVNAHPGGAEGVEVRREFDHARSSLRWLVAVLVKPAPTSAAAIAAARDELLNVLNILEGEVAAHAAPQNRNQLFRLLERARELLAGELP